MTNKLTPSKYYGKFKRPLNIQTRKKIRPSETLEENSFILFPKVHLTFILLKTIGLG